MSLLSAFQRQCRAVPDNLALAEGERRLNYSQLQQQADRLSAELLAKTESCERVVIALDRGIDATIAILASLTAGACYVPVDIKNPAGRLRYICQDAAPQCVIGQGPCPDWLHRSDLWLDISSTESQPAQIRHLEINDVESLASILYTSGSTGSPKGVALSHRAMINFVDWGRQTFAIAPDDRFASLAPFYFDLSVFDLFCSLSSGASVHFVPSGTTLAPSRLTAWLAEQDITRFYTVPSLLAFLTLKGSLNRIPLPGLKTILFAGEIFPTQQLKRLCDLLPAVDFYNLYGPTETNVCCYWPVLREHLQADRPIPIGLPACGAELKIAEDNGELWVKCDNNLSGYWQNGRLTHALSQDNYFATGDRVSRNEFGEYCYHGRIDRMLKCSGYRVEPAEIEAVILQCPGVIQCAVVGIKDSTSGQRPAAAVVLQPKISLTAVVKNSKRKLPAYMHPSKFIELKSIPLLANGKTDYLGLQKQLEPD